MNQDRPVSDIEITFLAIRNVLFEKSLNEPNKGVVAAKGTPRQRKMTWGELLKMVNVMEDFFIFRSQRTGYDSCETCKHWKSISKESPHMGECNKRGLRLVHAWSCCKKHEEKAP